MVDASGTNKYTYTIAGRLFTEDGPWASDTVTNFYNNGLRTNLSLAQPTGSWTNLFGYDAAKRLTNVTSKAGAFNYTLAATAPGSALIKKLSLPNGSYITNHYDSVARMRFTRLNNSSHTTLNKAEYGYNAGNQRHTMTNSANWSTNRYDSIGQLSVVDSSSNPEDRGYKYDTAWNLNYLTNAGTLQTFGSDVKNQLNIEPEGSHASDSNGNLSDLSGSGVLNGQYLPCSYDDENQLISVNKTGSSSGSPRADFTYDGQGRLRAMTNYTWGSGGWSPSGGKLYTYDGMRVIQERSTANAPTVSYTRGTDLSGSLEGAGGIGGMLARSHGYSAGNWSTHNFYHADGNGNITYLVNSAQTLAASYRYDAYGNLLAASGSLGLANVYRFSSKEVMTFNRYGNPSRELYYYGYRFYVPSLQRWLNRDPLGEEGGLNLYVFVANAPNLKIDAYGLQDGQTDTDRCKARCHDYINKLIKGGAGGANLTKTLESCLEGCDRNPNHIPSNPIPALPEMKPTLPKKPIWGLAKECVKGVWDWYKNRKADKEAIN